MELCNIKAIFFDADDTIADHKQCEKEALIYLFDKIEKEYKQQEEDIKGAKNANIKAVWYNPENEINNTQIKPYCQITNLIELKEIL